MGMFLKVIFKKRSQTLKTTIKVYLLLSQAGDIWTTFLGSFALLSDSEAFILFNVPGVILKSFMSRHKSWTETTRKTMKDILWRGLVLKTAKHRTSASFPTPGVTCPWEIQQCVYRRALLLKVHPVVCTHLLFV